MMKHLLLMTGTLLLTTALSVAAADLPHKGMTMSQVQSEFGAPKTKHPAVGHPPITRWDYDGYSVYFDHSAVIDAVGTIVPSAAPAPAAAAATSVSSPATGTTLNFQPLKAMTPPAGTVADESAPMTPVAAQPAASAPAPAAVTPPPPPPPPKPKYTFDPATGRIIIAAPTATSGAPAGSATSGK